MKRVLQQIIEKNKAEEKQRMQAIHAELAHPNTTNARRDFLKKAAMGGLALGGFMSMSIEDTLAHTTSRVNRSSAPSDLRIADMRVAVIRNVGRTPIIRIDTNQGISGYGDVRDGGDERYALMLKSRILGQNPCNVEQLFKVIRQFGYHGRQAGGVCAVETALWDLCGKAYGVPAWQLLGGRYRDKVRLYADTPGARDPETFAQTMQKRMVDQGFTFLKMDLGIHLANKTEGNLVNAEFWGNAAGQYDTREYMGYGNALHPFTQIQITDAGLEELSRYV